MAKIVYEVVADTKTAERELQKFNKTAETTLENGPKYDLVEDDTIQKFDKQIEYIESKISDLKEKLRQIDLGSESGDVFKIESQIEGYNNQLIKLKDKQDEIKNKTKETGNEIDKNKTKQQQLNLETNKHSFSLKDILKKVTKWGMAIIGVRSAYSLIRRAVSMVAGSNEQIANKMEQMRNVIANALTPLVQTVVNFLMKAMVYINYITKALFGKAIFDFTKATGDASKNMKSTQKSASGTAKALKQASKQLAGFDEMNVLTDNTSSGGGGTSGVGGVGGLDTKNMFEGLDDIKIPEWLEKLTGWIKSAIDWFNKLPPILKEVLGAVTLLLGSKALGTGLLGMGGILGKLATIGVIAIGIDIFYKATTGRELISDLKFIIEQVKSTNKVLEDQKGANDSVTESIRKKTSAHAEEIKKQQEVNEEERDYINNIILQASTIKKTQKDRDDYNNSTETRLYNARILNKVARNMTGEEKQLAEQRKASKEQVEALITPLQQLAKEGKLNSEQLQMLNILTDENITSESLRYSLIQDLIIKQHENALASENQADANEQVARSTQDGNYWINKYGLTLEDMTKNAGLSTEQNNKLREALNKFDKSDKGPQALLELIKTIESVGKQAGLSKDKIKDLVDKISTLKSKKITIDATLSIADVKEKIKGTVTNALKTLFGAKGMVIGYNKGGIVKYAKGGIINRPSRGVPLPLGGEHGMEGVVPLTDSQQMQLLGKAIGEFITINANITNTMNGRVISKELQKIQNDEAFGSNRW